MPERIQLRRKKGWRMPPNTVKVDRSTKWGNPFKCHHPGTPHEKPMTPELAVRLFRQQALEGGWFPKPLPWTSRQNPEAVHDPCRRAP